MQEKKIFVEKGGRKYFQTYSLIISVAVNHLVLIPVCRTRYLWTGIQNHKAHLYNTYVFP